MLGMASSTGLGRGDAFRPKDRPNVPQIADGPVAKAQHSQSDQALLDTAHFACDQWLKLNGLSVDERANMDRAGHCLRKAGAMEAPRLAAGNAKEEDPSAAWVETPVGDGPLGD